MNIGEHKKTSPT